MNQAKLTTSFVFIIIASWVLPASGADIDWKQQLIESQVQFSGEKSSCYGIALGGSLVLTHDICKSGSLITAKILNGEASQKSSLSFVKNCPTIHQYTPAGFRKNPFCFAVLDRKASFAPLIEIKPMDLKSLKANTENLFVAIDGEIHAVESTQLASTNKNFLGLRLQRKDGGKFCPGISGVGLFEKLPDSSPNLVGMVYILAARGNQEKQVVRNIKKFQSGEVAAGNICTSTAVAFPFTTSFVKDVVETISL